MEPPGSVRVVKKVCGVCTDLVRRCFDNLEWLN
jgi:hypothetical protein